MFCSFYLQCSLLVRHFIFSKLPAHQRRTDGFLQLVPETYHDDELVEWKPAPAPISRPDEPGDLGIKFHNKLIQVVPHFENTLIDLSR